MQKTIDTIKTIYARVNDYSNVYFRYVANNPKTTTALWAVLTFIVWRVS